MQAGKNCVVSLHYTLRDEQGTVLESTEGGPPIAYLHGQGHLLPGLERALEGKGAGEHVEVTVPPEEAFGPREPELVQVVPRSRFPADAELEPGMRFHAEGPQGTRTIVVVSIERDLVTVDGNHPLAGKTLHFKAEVTEVRNATREEVAHGHAHGPGGHAH